MSLWRDKELSELFLKSTPLIDVRAPIEFFSGNAPFSINLPILSDEERALVGTTYKEKGQASAIELGHRLVSGKNKDDKIKAWMDFLKEHPSAQVYCARGGMRSGISCEWMSEAGIPRQPIKGGYKRIRNFFLSILSEAPMDFIRLGGATGTGKSVVLQDFPNIDLEKLANHRGSAFGGQGEQPAQASFENALGLEILKNVGKRFLLEDESATIGKIVLPRRLFQVMRDSNIVVLEAPVEERARRIFEQYVCTKDREFFLKGLERIQKSLGGVDYGRAKEMMEEAFAHEPQFSRHEEWITFLLVRYYDPIYARGLSKQSEKVLFKGCESDLKEFLKENL